MIFFVFFHILSLHVEGSSNPLGVHNQLDKVSFFPFFIVKDLFIPFIVIFFYFLVSLLNPIFFSDPINFIIANPIVTPVHIQPEWYFLFAYAILRVVPNKLGGVISLLIALVFVIIKFIFKKIGSYSKKKRKTIF